MVLPLYTLAERSETSLDESLSSTCWKTLHGRGRSGVSWSSLYGVRRTIHLILKPIGVFEVNHTGGECPQSEKGTTIHSLSCRNDRRRTSNVLFLQSQLTAQSTGCTSPSPMLSSAQFGVMVTILGLVYSVDQWGDFLRDHVWSLTMASLSPLQANAARTELQWTFYLAHYCSHMLQLCCRAFSFQYYRGQTGWDWLPLPEPPDYILGLEPGIMKSVAPNRNRSSCMQLDPEGSSGRVG